MVGLSFWNNSKEICRVTKLQLRLMWDSTCRHLSTAQTCVAVSASSSRVTGPSTGLAMFPSLFCSGDCFDAERRVSRPDATPGEAIHNGSIIVHHIHSRTPCHGLLRVNACSVSLSSGCVGQDADSLSRAPHSVAWIALLAVVTRSAASKPSSAAAAAPLGLRSAAVLCHSKWCTCCACWQAQKNAFWCAAVCC